MIPDNFNKKYSFLSALPEKFQNEVLQLGTESLFKKGEIIFSEGVEGTYFCVLISGTVRIYKTAPDGKEVNMRLIHDGEMFGEVILFEDELFPVSSVALKHSKICIIPRNSFLNLLKGEEFRNDFITVIMRKQRYLAERILHLTAYDVEYRFFNFLEENYGRTSSYIIDLNKQDIASAIGTIPETLSRLLSRLKKRGIISWDENRLIINEDVWGGDD
jgi:CRP/FNR family transcriptional regulator